MAGCIGIPSIKSKAAALIVLQQYVVCAHFFTGLWLLTQMKYESASRFTFPELFYGPAAAGFIVIALSCPITGWLADVHFGRYRVMRFGLRVLWTATILTVVWLLVLNDVCKDHHHLCIEIEAGVGIVLITLSVVAVAIHEVNAIQFGIDQIPEASAEELCSLIHWFMWAAFAGELTARIVHLPRFCIPHLRCRPYLVAAVQFLVPATLVTASISFDFLFRGWLTRQPKKQNPLRTIIQVLRFAASHKYPQRHCLVNYCTGRVSRIDFAKDKYGGPYTSEEVEDVKSLLRIAAIIVSTTAFITPFMLYQTSTTYLLAFHSKIKSINKQCSENCLAVFTSPSVFAVVLIPLYEFLYPFIRNRIPKILARVGMAAGLTVVLCGSILTVDTIKHAVEPKTVCMFANNSDSMAFYPAFWFVIPTNLLTAMVLVLYSTAIVEFIFAQTPYNMRGFMMGLMFTAFSITIPVTYGIFISWNNFTQHIKPSCDFYYFLFQFLFAVIGIIIFYATARRYKWRQREEEDQQTAAGLYDRVE